MNLFEYQEMIYLKYQLIKTKFINSLLCLKYQNIFGELRAYSIEPKAVGLSCGRPGVLLIK